MVTAIEANDHAAASEAHRINRKEKNGKGVTIYTQQKCSSTVCQQAISHRGPAYWNCFPFDLRNKKQNVRSFTVNVYKYLLSNENNI